jgi:hypothetical protein
MAQIVLVEDQENWVKNISSTLQEEGRHEILEVVCDISRMEVLFTRISSGEFPVETIFVVADVFRSDEHKDRDRGLGQRIIDTCGEANYIVVGLYAGIRPLEGAYTVLEKGFGGESFKLPDVLSEIESSRIESESVCGAEVEN